MNARTDAQYLFRLDDVCPTMKWQRFAELVALFDHYHISPILGIVPDNQDPKLNVAPARADFWSHMRKRQAAQWTIAQHGYQHRYVTNEAGLLGLRPRSEFAGLPYDKQYQKIAAGKRILEQELGQPATWWTAPAHSFDATTCRVLQELDFIHISDGIALYPFIDQGLTWVPHQLWQPAWRPFGVWTIGIHLNTMSNHLFDQLTQFIERYSEQCRSVSLEPRSHAFNGLYRSAWYAKFYSLRYVRH